MRMLCLTALGIIGVNTFGQAPTDSLEITVIDGDGSINNIRKHAAREPVVAVEDQNHNRISGAVVVFTLPNQGPGGTFASGGNTLWTITDSGGRAIARGLRPNNLAGKFEIRVNASYEDKTAHLIMFQTNAGAAVPTHVSKWVIVAAAIGATAGGIVAATAHGGGSSSPSTTTPSGVTVTPGAGTVGPPH